MAQHHLHSKEARNFASFRRSMTEEEAESLLAEVRWGSKDMQMCPKCGVVYRHYRKHRRRRWRCSKCTCEFSVTSGSALHSHKIPFKVIIEAVFEFVNHVKGAAILQMSRQLGLTPKTCQVFEGKIREFLVKCTDLTPLQGTVHMDGAYFCGKPRKPNRKIKMPAEAIAKRFGSKKIQNTSRPWIEMGMTQQNWRRQADKRVVMSLCASAGKGNGSARVLAFVCHSENAVDIKNLAARLLTPGTIVMTDEHAAYGVLSGPYEHYSVCHAEEFCTAEGVCNNMSETFNSRARRAQFGVHHGFRPKYLQDYMSESAWRETNRKLSQRDQVLEILRVLLSTGKSE
ncbi:IS1595 family transposase [Dyella nitratireducens]|uniref:ISXO2-like transposase domain-containing protein n=1 Tax=Dyella nitratireducens TaxID=1849580 RepID=A0ABQ1GM97_9GAMM|nr:IS1595 family transposase [Dyella nitratireducens]GGA46591.1 hypothetical protein GCM10010981_39670 [Dyella nitratireducens]GLQ41469.1 hypothetical protein GCM10007902_13190 [Dyella nitratireducens]